MNKIIALPGTERRAERWVLKQAQAGHDIDWLDAISAIKSSTTDSDNCSYTRAKILPQDTVFIVLNGDEDIELAAAIARCVTLSGGSVYMLFLEVPTTIPTILGQVANTCTFLDSTDFDGALGSPSWPSSSQRSTKAAGEGLATPTRTRPVHVKCQ
jgi:hypothetical protein